MRYLVVLDCRSAVGAGYFAGSNDGLVKGGPDLSHPALDCSEIDTSNIHYLWVKREIAKGKKGTQTLFLPHGAIVNIVCYADEGPKPLGFLADKGHT